MASDLIGIGTGALLAFQRALSTTGHNISNANTDGYTRQRTTLVTSEPLQFGSGYRGTGVQVGQIERVYNRFLDAQVNVADSELQRLTVFQSLASRMDRLLSDPASGLSNVMQQFFDAAGDVASDPGSITARDVLLGQAGLLAGRFNDIGRQLDDMQLQINDEIRLQAEEINGFAKSIAGLNNQISLATSAGITANDLLDRRDQLIQELSGRISIKTVAQQDGSLNVFIGSGQPLVTGGMAGRLAGHPNSFNSAQLDIGIENGNAIIDITSIVGGGRLGGLIQFRESALSPALNQTGLIAEAIAREVNRIQITGRDLNGATGVALFTEPGPEVMSSQYNTGTATMNATLGNLAGLTGSDYLLRYDGSGQWTSTRLTDNQSITLNLPAVLDGLQLSITGTPAVGDRFLVQPGRNAARQISVRNLNPSEIAAALPIRASINPANRGSATASQGEVLDPTHPALLTTTRLVFADATHYQIDGAGPLLNYQSGSPIDVNGWRVTLSGQPVAGDEFTVAATTNASGDNRNILSLTNLQTASILQGGRQTLNGMYSTLIGTTGETARNSEQNRVAMQTVHEQAIAAREGVSGVNLDEEAASMIRYEQSYQAAARVISIANDLFDSLLLAIRR